MAKKTILFFALFALFVFFPFQTVFSICVDGTLGGPCGTSGYGRLECSNNVMICVADWYGQCGDGIINGPESNTGRCDDGDNTSGDGCSSTCYVQSGWYCLAGNPSICYQNCGNGTVTTPEGCDWGQVGRPGATISSGGNGIVCTATYGNTCTYCNNSCVNTTVTGPRCGDNILQSTNGEMCDSNLTSNPCTPSYGSSCNWCDLSCKNHAVIGPSCGDGIVQSANGETCDSNRTSTACTPPYGGTCNWCNLSCQNNLVTGPSCGDGIVQSANGENCDSNRTSTACTPPYGGSCNWCDLSCQNHMVTSTSVCGNNIKEGTEVCDGTDKNQQSCPSQGFTTGTLACAGNCGSFNTSACYNQTCGNAVREGTEVCDITALNNQTCTTQNFTTGTLACAGNCGSFNTSSCYNQTCGNGVIETGENCDDGNTTTEECAYGLRSCVICDNTCHTVAGAISYCSDSVVNGPEECDYDSLPATVIPHNFDGCNTTCQEEDGWNCFTSPATGKNICIFHCGNEVVEHNALIFEECDEGAEGQNKLVTSTQTISTTTTAPYNGERCTTTNYGETCNWCTTDCKESTLRGPYCGDGTVDGDNEQCDDGNFNPGDGCDQCVIETGWTCKGLYSVCTTTCGDLKCVRTNNRETCINCSTDCGSCPLGQRPGVAVAHQENLFVNFFDKLKATFTRPTLLINLPGVKIDDAGLDTPALPAPVISEYALNIPNEILIGDETYIFTVFKSDRTTREVTFSIR